MPALVRRTEVDSSCSPPRRCGNPYDGRTLATVVPDIEKTTGATLARIIADADYRGHNAPPPYDMRVYTAGQKRRMTDEIRRKMRRRSAVEPVIGHVKAEHRMAAITSQAPPATPSAP